jgi:hypothetical protein
MPGTVTSGVEVTNVSRHCLWILLGEEELAIPYRDFPWFKQATIDQVLNVTRPAPDHLYWPDLDIDLSVASIRRPEDFPLLSGTGSRPSADLSSLQPKP